MTRIIKHPDVTHDIDVIVEYLAPRNLDATIRLLEAFEETVEQLRQYPKLGNHPPFLTQKRHKNIRFRIISMFPNYLVFYQEIPGGIEVLHFFHGAQDIPDIFESY